MLINQLLEIAPAGALVAAGVWGGLSYTITGPELASRVAKADYVANCEANLAKTIAASFDQQIEATGGPSSVERNSAMVAPMMDQMYGQFGDQMAFLDMLSGGAYAQMQRSANDAARHAREAREKVAAAIKARRDDAVASAPDQCSCQVVAALNETRSDWAFFAGTFGIIEKDGVTEFPSVMRANVRICAERVLP